MKKIFFLLILVPGIMNLFSQDTNSVSLDQCYEQAILNYPNFKQLELNEAINELSNENTQTNYLPTLNLFGQASWQSDVTKMPIPNTIPGFTNPVIPNDWYKLNLDVGQLIYDGGATKAQKDLNEKDRNISDQQVAIEVYQLKDQINNLYFNILFLDQSVDVLKVLSESLEANITDAQTAFDNGMILKSEVNKLKVEKVKVDQQIVEQEYLIKAIISSLNELTKIGIDSSAQLITPDIEIKKYTFINLRPEYLMLNKQKEKIGSVKNLTKVQRRPIFSAFGQAGYGRPGYDMLNNKFDDYYMIGARLNWNIWDWNKARNQKQILDIQSEIIDYQKQTYDQKLAADLYQRIENVHKYERMIVSDKEIVDLQTEVVKTVLDQFSNGAITSTTYLIELNKLATSKLNLEANKVQLIFAKYQYLSATGQL